VQVRHIQLHHLLGTNPLGTMWLGSWQGHTVAIKRLADSSAEDEDYVSQELRLLATLRHPNLVWFYGAGTWDGSNFIVQEFLPRGNVQDLLADSSVPLNPGRRLLFAVDTAKALAFMHGLRPARCHQRLGTARMLVGADWTVKLSGLRSGASLHLQVDDDGLRRETLEALQPRFRSHAGRAAPEMATRAGLGPHDGAVGDVFAFGLVLWELWTRAQPFREHGIHADLDEAVQQGHRPVIPRNCPATYAVLITLCWEQNARKRPRFAEVLPRLQAMRSDAVFRLDEHHVAPVSAMPEVPPDQLSQQPQIRVPQQIGTGAFFPTQELARFRTGESVSGSGSSSSGSRSRSRSRSRSGSGSRSASSSDAEDGFTEASALRGIQ